MKPTSLITTTSLTVSLTTFILFSLFCLFGEGKFCSKFKLKEMNWRKKNSSSGFSSLSQSLFPTSWLSKFKQISKKSNSPIAKTKQKTKPNSPFSSPSLHTHQEFVKVQGKSSNQDVAKSVFNDTHDEIELEFPFSSCRSCKSSVTREDNHSFSDMVSDIRKMRISRHEDDQESKLDTPRRRIPKARKGTNRKLTKKGGRILEESVKECADLVEQSILDLEAIETTQIAPESEFRARKSQYISSSNSICTQCDDDKIKFEGYENGAKALKEVKVTKSEKQRKSMHISREQQKRRVKHSCKVKAYSPRTASKIEICKIRALEDMKKAKMKKKARIVEEGLALESFAVEKHSFDPQKDFRDSMVEMIEENGIWKAEELENLLACYLSLNSNEYHDVIVKVFRQVWFAMNQPCSDSESQNGDHCSFDY